MFGAVWAQAELRQILRACGARVLDRQLPVGRAGEAFAADGSLADTTLADALAEIVNQLVGLVPRNEVNGERGEPRTARIRAVA